MSAQTENGPRMPLLSRRLVLIGGLSVLAGAVGGQFVFGAQAAALAGIVLIAVALSYDSDQKWASPLTWSAAAVGVIWSAVTVAYWWAVVGAATSSVPAPSWTPALFIVGVGAFAVLAAITMAASVKRMLRRRRPAAGNDLPGETPQPQ